MASFQKRITSSKFFSKIRLLAPLALTPKTLVSGTFCSSTALHKLEVKIFLKLLNTSDFIEFLRGH